MLDQSTRTAILKLHEQGHSLRGIARVMRLSRGAYSSCKGNLVRVHEE
jgi:hypothetical protein